MIVSFGLFFIAPNNYPLSYIPISRMYTKPDKERYITDMETRSLSSHYSIASCLLPLIPPSISLFSFRSHQPPLPSLCSPSLGQWHAGYSVCACAVVYKQDVAAIRRNPICYRVCSQKQITGGDGKILMSQMNNTHTDIRTLPKQTHKRVLQAKSNNLVLASKHHVYSLAMDKSIDLASQNILELDEYFF